MNRAPSSRTRRQARAVPTRTISKWPHDRTELWVVKSWIDFWFRAIDPVGLHALRFLTGVLLIAWLVPFLGNTEAMFGLEGWFDQQAYREAARLPVEERPVFGWSILYLCGSNPLLLRGACAGAIVMFSLFALGIATRVTAIASWVMVVSFSANPAFGYDADGLLVLLVFYLMVGYVFLNQTQRDQSLAARCLGSRQQIVLFNWARSAEAVESRPSVVANVALRLLQVHWAMAIVASGLHKLQFGDWWAGVALWYPLYPPLSATLEDARSHSPHGIAWLTVLSLAAYAVLAWQIAFPVFAWKPHWRWLLLAGAGLGWLGCVWLYELPLFGAVLFLGCLSYLTPVEWRRIGTKLSIVLSSSAPRKNAETLLSRSERRHLFSAQCLVGSLFIGLMCSGCAPIDAPDVEAPTNTTSHDAHNAIVLPTAIAKPSDDVLPEQAASREDAGRANRAVALPDALRQRIDAAIDQVQRREVLTSHGFWTVFHALLGVGIDLKLIDPTTGQGVSAIEHISGGGNLRGMRFIPAPAGLDVQIGPTFVGQGHADQFVAEMLQVGVAAVHPFIVDGRQYTLMDFIRHTQSRVRVTEGQELSWAIVAIGQCLGTDVQWTNRFGELLHFEDLVRYELEQDVEGAACGGTHRLFGLQWVYQLHLSSGRAATGVWQEVADKMSHYQDRARELQNTDGSFSTDFFRGPGNLDDMQQRINSTGHIFEWLAQSLPEEQLQDNWVQEAANALSLMILDIQSAPMEGGTLYHATHGLRLYRARCVD